MKKKITFPDWTAPACLIVSRGPNPDNPRPVWSDYAQDPADWLSIRVTVEIAGGSCLFERFNSPEERDAAYLEQHRRTAWRNAIRFAEELWRSAPHKSFVVQFRPESPNTGREAVCIYQRILRPSAERTAAQ